MKRFLLVCVGLLGFYAALAWMYDGCVLWLMRHSPSCTATKIERVVKGGEGEAIAIFGSSRALGNYMPSAFSTNAFNYGVNGMSLNEALTLVDQYLQHNSSDSTIIINLDPWGFADPDTVHLAGDYRLAARCRSVRDSIPNLSLSWVDWVPRFRFQGQLRKSLTEYLNARKAYTKKIDNGAELLLNSRTESEWATIKKDLKPYSFFCDSRCEEQLESLYEKQGRHRIVWVVTPTCSAYHPLHQNPSAMRDFLLQQARRSNVTIANLFDNVSNFSDSLFTDPTHFNVTGSKKFSQALKAYLDKVIVRVD